MTRLQQLKNEARKAEQRSDWARAIELYKDVIQRGEDRGSSADAGTYNRVGDLYLRQGDTGSAVEYYQEAADRYAASGLHTSAIALCNKILRIAPAQDDVYGRLARLHASTGLLAEARSAFLQFSERMRSRNRLSEALETVQDLVNLTGDEELRTAFAEQLVDAGLTGQAVAQLRLVYEARVAAGRNAQDIRERIIQLDPDADPVGGPDPAPPRATVTPAPPKPAVTPVPGEPSERPAPEEPIELPDADEVPLEELLGMQSLDEEADAPLDMTSRVPDDTAAPRPSPAPVDEIPAAGVDMESVLTRFRSEVLQIVDETDYAVHYDLGVAYMGMGLLDDAIGEFQLAIQSPAQMEAAHALLGECLRARGTRSDRGVATSSAADPGREAESGNGAGEPISLDLELPIGEEEGEALDPGGIVLDPVADGPAIGAPATDGPPNRAVEDAAARHGFILGDAPDVAPPGATPGADAVAGGLAHEAGASMTEEPVGPGTEDGSDDLANMLFQARLAQHRVRQAADEGRVDHRAHLELGRTYQEMGLHAEAVENLVAAADGPGSVSGEALTDLERLAADPGIEAVPLREALTCLIARGRQAAAEAAARAFSARVDVATADRQAVLDMLPAAADGPPSAAHPGPGSSPAPGTEPLGELEGIMAELEAAADEAEVDSAPSIPEPDLGPAALFGEAEGLREAGRLDEAASHYYRALELYEKERDALSAIRVVDRLLGLRPEDVVLHHQKTEFAIMTNDRELLVTSYLDLASCLRRQNGLRSARTVYGRILDLDPANAEARAGVAALDAEELSRERQRQSRPRTASPAPPPGDAHGPAPASGLEILPAFETDPSAEASETITPASLEARPAGVDDPSADFDQMFDDLRNPADAGEPDYESHYELGVAFRQMQMWDEAAREFKLAVEGMDEPMRAYEMLGEALNHLRRYDEARRTLSTAIARPGGDGMAKAGILFHLGVAHMRAGEATEAKACLERAVRLDPGRSEAAHLLSTLSR